MLPSVLIVRKIPGFDKLTCDANMLSLNATVPVAVFLLGAAFGLEEMSYKMLSIMSVISVGVIVASVGEITISWVGVVYQMGGVVAEALRLIFIEIFLKKKGVKLNLISMMYYVSPCRCVFPFTILIK
jgi:drug/metabolite transporter (DMT)-like permease